MTMSTVHNLETLREMSNKDVFLMGKRMALLSASKMVIVLFPTEQMNEIERLANRVAHNLLRAVTEQGAGCWAPVV